MHPGMTPGAFFRWQYLLASQDSTASCRIWQHSRRMFFYSSGAFSEGGQRDKGKAAHKGTAKVTKDIDPNKLERT